MAVDLSGAYSGSSAPVTTGDFYHLSGTSRPPNTDNPYTDCAMDSRHAGNPWGITVLTDA